MRVVVTGSRDFADDLVVTQVLQGIYEIHAIGWMTTHLDPLTIIDGQCPYGGADELAYKWATTPGPHPADTEWTWEARLPGEYPDTCPVLSERFPPRAHTAAEYHARNRAMVDSGADLCVGFINKPLPQSRGTRATLEYAESKGVKTALISVPALAKEKFFT